MKTRFVTAIAVISVLSMTLSPAIVKEAKGKPISETRTASCITKITSDPTVIPMNLLGAEDLICSSAVIGKAGRDILDIPHEVSVNLVEILDLSADAARNTVPFGATRMGNHGETYKPREDSTTLTTPVTASNDLRHTEDLMYGASSLPRVSSSRYGSSSTSRFAKKDGDYPYGMGSDSAIPEHTTLMFTLNINLANSEDDLPPLAEEFMLAIIDNLQTVLEKAFQSVSQRLKRQMDMVDRQTMEARSQLAKLQAELRALSGIDILDRRNIQEKLSVLREDIERITLESLSNKIAIEELTNQIARTQAVLEDQVNEDVILGELRKLLEICQVNIANTKSMVESGRASMSTLNEANMKLAQAKIELAKRQEQLNVQYGGMQLNTLQQQHMELTLKESQAQVRREFLLQQSDRTRQLLEKSDEYEIKSLELDMAKHNLTEALLIQNRLSRRLIQPPSVAAIGAE